MDTITDWIGLWRELVVRRDWRFQSDPSAASPDHWRAKAQEFDSHVRRRWAKPDSSRAFVISMLDARPRSTVLDIGAGTGKWAILLARHAEAVTAIEPSPAMIELLENNVSAEKLANVEVVRAEWPNASVATHDFSLCSHAMYGSPDLRSFIEKMQAATRHTCILLMRAPLMDGVMAEASRHVWGHPYDSPNYQVGLNALWQMGIFPNVLMEDTGLWEPWVNESIEEALGDIKRRLGLNDVPEHDEFLMDLLNRRLTRVGDKFVWPRGVRTAMLFWQVNPETRNEMEC